MSYIYIYIYIRDIENGNILPDFPHSLNNVGARFATLLRQMKFPVFVMRPKDAKNFFPSCVRARFVKIFMDTTYFRAAQVI